MAEIEATSKLLNYAMNSKRATASRSIRVKQPCVNGDEFNGTQQIIFRLPSNVRNTFLDGETVYLNMNVSVDVNCNVEGSCGAYGFIDRIEILSSGQTLMSLDGYAELLSLFADLECSSQGKDNRYKLMCGLGSDRFTGTAIASANYSKFSLPLHLTLFQSMAHYLPLFSRDALEIRITLNSNDKAIVAAAASVWTIWSPELVYYQVEVNDNAMTMINENCGGVYSLNCKDFRHTRFAVPATANGGGVVNTLGFSMSSLESMLVAVIPTANNVLSKPSNSNRTTFLGNDGEFNLTLNGERIPSRLIKGSPAETMAEIAIRERTLGTFYHPSSINGDANTFNVNDGAGSSSATTGSYFLCVDLESMRPQSSDEMYAGVSTVGGVLQSEIKAGVAIPASYIHYFAQNTINLTLDMNGSQTWVVSV